MQRFDDFDRLEVLTRITGSLVNLTPLRVGVGREPPLGASIDAAPLRIRFAAGGTFPYIPGSSLKGVLRSFAESILRAKGAYVHDPWNFEVIEEEKKNRSFCLICGIFGSAGLASHVRVYDAYPESEVPTFVKTGIGINRDFRCVQRRILYTEEQVAPRVRWGFMMDVINIRIFPEPGDERGRLLRQLLQMLASGTVQVGARRTVGYGLVKLEQGKYEVYEVKDGLLTKVSEGDVV